MLDHKEQLMNAALKHLHFSKNSSELAKIYELAAQDAKEQAQLHMMQNQLLIKEFLKVCDDEGINEFIMAGNKMFIHKNELGDLSVSKPYPIQSLN